jgi:hypothetical protein
MSPFEQIALAWQSLGFTLRQAARPALWAPSALLGAIQAVLVVGLWWFAHPWVSWWAAPLLARLAGAGALHYPDHMRALPAAYAQVDLVLGVVLGSVLIGASTALFGACFAGQPLHPGRGMARAFRRGLTLIVANLPLHLLVLALATGLQAWVEKEGGGPMTRRSAWAMGLGGALLLQALFLYVTPLVMLGHHGLRGVLVALPRAIARGGWAALSLSLLALLVLLPVQQLERVAEVIVERGVPDLVAWLVLAEAMLALMVSFLLTGSATLVYQSAVARRARE